MQVGILSHNARPRDAIGNAIAHKARFLVERGHRVRLIAEVVDPLHPSLERLAIQASAGTLGDDARSYLSSCDLIIVEYGQFYCLLEHLPWLRQQPGRIVFDYHGVSPPKLWDPAAKELLAHSCRMRCLVWFADLALVHSEHSQLELLSATGYPESRCRKVPLAIDPPAASASQLSLRKRLGIDQGIPLLLFVGRIAPNKRVGLAIEALARLGDSRPHLLIIGDDQDLYARERARCERLADSLGVSNRVHFLGQVGDADLASAYQESALFIMPSVHEGFCVPLVEAMSAGLPIVASRSAAIPETLGPAGLLHHPDNSGDLATQATRLLAKPQAAAGTKGRIAVASFRFHAKAIGGAERSLRILTDCLKAMGYQVEVFTTCTIEESAWSNQLHEGTTIEDGIKIHRFPLDPHDRQAHCRSVQRLIELDHTPDRNDEAAYVRHSIRSQALVEAIASYDPELVLTGPYLFGLTYDIAQRFASRVILLPCYHDERLAYLPVWRDAYLPVRAVWYHSPEEQAFAEATLGLNHPGSACVGSWLEPADASSHCRGEIPYVLYCGRLSEQKNLPQLLAWAERYQAENPGKLKWVFAGKGDFQLPKRSWIDSLGPVDEALKQELMAGALALVQLSRNESLSLVVLEAWQQGTPVIVHSGCRPLAGHLSRAAGGGWAVGSYADFATALDQLQRNPGIGAAQGEIGRRYVNAAYACKASFQGRVAKALELARADLKEQIRVQSRARSGLFSLSNWQQTFESSIEQVLQASKREPTISCELAARSPVCQAADGQNSVLVSVRIHNSGSVPFLARGDHRCFLRCRLEDGISYDSPLPESLGPDEEMSVLARVPVRNVQDRGRVFCQLLSASDKTKAITEIELPVAGESGQDGSRVLGEAIQRIQRLLSEAEARCDLPDDYEDVSLGWTAAIKKWLKRKVLGNFKHAYVDAISHQQSRLNRQIIGALAELVEAVSLLEQRVGHSIAHATPQHLSPRSNLLSPRPHMLDNREESHHQAPEPQNEVLAWRSDSSEPPVT